VLFLVPILFNIVALLHDIGFHTLSQVVSGNFKGFTGYAYNPLPEIIVELLAFSFTLTTLSLFIIFLANLKVLRRLPTILKLLFRLILILPSSVVFCYASGVVMPLSWLPKFNDYLLGLPGSQFAFEGSWLFVFPITILVIFLAVRIFEKIVEPSTNNVLPRSVGAG
jgi:hypothetical protein